MAKIVGASFAYFLAVLLSVRWLEHKPPAPWKYGIAILPVLPVAFIPLAVVQFVREQDELQRKIQLEALAFGFTAAAIVTVTYGFLENAGLPRLNWVWVWPVMACLWAAGVFLARRRYR